MERLDATKPAGPEDLFESIREVRTKVNEIIEENDVLIERLAKFEGENDTLKKRLDMTDAALMKALNQIALHKHGEKLGEAVMPLAV